MSKFTIAIIIFVATFLAGCSDGFEENGYTVGPKGEPPKALKLGYSRKFTVEQKNYVKALGEIHAFLIENKFSPYYRPCFSDVLDIRVTANIKKNKETFPCVLVGAAKGELTNVYFNVTIDDVMFNQLDNNNRLILTVNMYGKDGLAAPFSKNIEPKLTKLYQPPTERKCACWLITMRSNRSLRSLGLAKARPLA
ncbi:hypothetical protein [Phytopseudomonas seleniipraecipitans]|uniref:hypothetical protein n=1 Tax=Phytopseudomonas seleniipraecipitans TaxID=640205 RepID=UPI00115FA9F6|nr:hypothetical protein [Pseudomonas seleniipraecipitans]